MHPLFFSRRVLFPPLRSPQPPNPPIHQGDFVSGQGGVIYKKASQMEQRAFERLMADPLKTMVPLYFECMYLSDKAGREAEYLGMQELLGLFEDGDLTMTVVKSRPQP